MLTESNSKFIKTSLHSSAASDGRAELAETVKCYLAACTVLAHNRSSVDVFRDGAGFCANKVGALCSGVKR